MATQTKPTMTRTMKLNNTGDNLADQSVMWFIASLFISLPGVLIITGLYLLDFLSADALMPIGAAVLAPFVLAVLFALAAFVVNALAGKVDTEGWAAFYEYYEN